MKSYFYCLLSAILFTSYNTKAQEPKGEKIALVVGVSNYEHASPLKNTLNDAEDMSAKLSLIGFKVIKLLDPDIKSLNNKLDSVGKGLKQSDIILFFFSGHGAEYNGENYLFLKNSNPVIPNDMPYETFALGKLLGKIEYAKPKTSVIILDACRSNPFVRGWSRNGIASEGLVNIDAPNGTFVGYAASPGKTASDGIHRNGTYTEAILKYIDVKNISIDEVFNKVNKEVRIQSGGKQIPFKNSSLDDDFYFNKEESTFKQSDDINSFQNSRIIIAPINRPKFPMPKIMRGYSSNVLNSFGSASINKSTFDNNEFIELNLNLIGENIWDKATPIYVEIVKRTSPGAVLMIYGEQFQPKSRNTKIKISASLESGRYELTFGFYLVNELNQEYPPFYSKKFNINIL